MYRLYNVQTRFKSEDFVTFRTFKLVLLAGAVSVAANAAAVSMTNDFSLALNPNGQWSYQNGTTNLTFQIPQNNGNGFIPAVAAGYWSIGNNLNTDTPDFAKVQVNCSSAGETDLDCLAGDIVGHSPNGPTALNIRWTAPADGFVSTLSMSIWYAHSAAGFRSNDFALLLNAGTLTSGTVNPSTFPDRNNRDTYNNPGFAVNAGDVITLSIGKTAGQSFGSLDGMTLDFNFDASAVPEPATVSLMGLCFVAVGLALRRRRA